MNFFSAWDTKSWFVVFGTVLTTIALVHVLEHVIQISDHEFGLSFQLVQELPVQEVDQFMVPVDDTCAKEVIHSLNDDPCYAKTVTVGGYKTNARECSCDTSEIKPYMIPHSVRAVPLTAQQLQHEALFVFVHVNKAAGTTMKQALFHIVHDAQWDGIAYGVTVGWNRMGPSYRDRNPPAQLPAPNVTGYHFEETITRSASNSIYIRCGKPLVERTATKLPPTLRRFHSCPLRALWGNRALGLCDHFPGKPCVYFTVVRNPIERAVSDYKYFCLHGAERKKKWTSAMKARGKCDIGIVEYFTRGFTSPNFLADRFAKGCNPGSVCSTVAAIENLKHPCLRYLLTTKLSDGLEKLGNTFGGHFKTTLRRYSEQRVVFNKAKGADDPWKLSPSEEAKLRLLFRADLEIFQAAEAHYAKQWQQPLVSCNAV